MRYLKRLISLAVTVSMIFSMLMVQMPVSAEASSISGNDIGVTTLIGTGTTPEGFETGFTSGESMPKDGTDWFEAQNAEKLNVTKSIISEGDGDNALQIKISTTAVSGTHADSKFGINVGSTEAGVYSLTFEADFDLAEGSGFSVYLNNDASQGAGKNGQLILTNNANTKKGIAFTDGNSYTTTKVSGPHKYRIVYNTISKMAALYLDDETEPKIDFFTFSSGNAKTLSTVGSVSFLINRSNSVDKYANFDNILFTRQSATAYDAEKTLPADLSYEGANITLPNKGLTGSDIAWESSDAVISVTEGADNDTAVVTPADTEKTVTLTATVSDGTSANTTKTYTLEIPGTGGSSGTDPEPEDTGDAAADAKALTLSNSITTAGALPQKGASGSKITWTADVDGIVVDNNNVLPADAAKKVTFTASLKGADATPVTKTFKDIFVGTADQLIAYDADALSAPVYYGQKRLSLVSEGEAGSRITWSVNDGVSIETSDDPDTTNTNELGTVTVTDALQKAELTATVTYTGTTGAAERKFYLTIPSKSQPLDEDFEYPVVSAGTSVDGFNGWTIKIPDDNASVYTEDTTVTIDGDTGKYLSIKRVQEEGSSQTKPSSASKQYTVNKRFPAIIGGKAKISFDVMLNVDSGTSKRFYLVLGGSDIDFQSQLIKIGDNEIEKPYWKENEYNNVEIIANLADSTAEFFINGTSCGTHTLPNCGGVLEEISIKTVRSVGVYGNELCFDNFVAETIPVDMVISAVSFTDGSGNKVIGAQTGGKIAGVTVSANKDMDSAWIVAAVYDSNDNFSYAVTGKAADLKTNKNTEIEFNDTNTLPENAKIKLFAMESDARLKPLTFPAKYSRPADAKLKFVMLGDSMMCNYNAEKTNKIGVGMVIGDYFSDEVSVLNLGRSGASTETYYENEGKSDQSLQAHLSEINNGDYVFIMFGHNDTTKAEKGTTLEEYKDYLTKMIIMVRTKGAVPVLLSPIVRYDWKTGNTELDNDALAGRTAEMNKLADELNAVYIDVNTYTKTLIEDYGYDSAEAKAFYLLDADKNDGFVVDSTDSFTGSDGWDTTHMTETGAKAVASYIASEINKKDLLPTGYYIGG